MRSRWVGIVAVMGSTLALAACGGADVPTATSDNEAIATEFRTFPPPTTTIPPTTTVPPEPGSILASEATYVVAEGDYPFVVADRFGVDFDEFVALNGWTVEDGAVPEWPAPGTVIRIPAGATVPDGPSELTPVGTVAPDPSDSVVPGTGDSATGTSTSVDSGVGCGTYTIVEGDYLGRVATKLDTTVDALNAANQDTDGYAAFYPGLQIAVPC